MGVVNAFGLYYVVDATGMVLECAGSAYPDTVAGPKINNLILDDNSRVTVGERLPVRDSGQLAAVQRVLDRAGQHRTCWGSDFAAGRQESGQSCI